MARVVEHQAALLLELQLAWRDVSPTGFRHTGSRGGKQERITIRRCTNDCLGANIGPRAGSVFNDERLPEPLGQQFPHYARDEVYVAPGCKGRNHTHRPRRISLRPCDARDRRERGSAGGQL